MAEKPADHAIQSIERALVILETLSRFPQGIGVTELGQLVGLHKSTAHRLLSTLRAYGYVEQYKDSERYRLGNKILSLGLEVLANLDFRKEALPFMRELVEISRETVQLAVLDSHQVLVVERDQSPETITVNLGLRADAHCTAEGKVLLAYLPVKEVTRILDEGRMRQYTVNTVTDVNNMLAQLEKIRNQGYAINAEELAEGLRAVAAPVFDHTGRVIAALSISGPTSRLTLERLGRLVTVLKEACSSVSTRLGYRPSTAKALAGRK
ncbi:MAG: IclR family transcriptional regulator [Peptococcaceae bacterium]|nr:IclR family transcriptional regulator [Peptococcaceae bacterium]